MRPRTNLVRLRRVIIWSFSWPSCTSRPPLRTFTQTRITHLAVRGVRPQLPFLAIPSWQEQQHVRYLTTERRAWLKRELTLGATICGYSFAALCLLVVAGMAILEEVKEHEYPTPRELRFRTRIMLRSALQEAEPRAAGLGCNWPAVCGIMVKVVERLEDPALDGDGVVEIPPEHGGPRGVKNISHMPESWRMGYVQALMVGAKAAELVEGWVIDRTRNTVYPPYVVIGSSNPNRKPMPIGVDGAPREENCELAFPSPDELYLKLIHTVGIQNRQRMEACLAYASWLEHKGQPGPASNMYKDAVRLAIQERSTPSPPVDLQTHLLCEEAGPPSANLLQSLTAYAAFGARNNDVASALAIFISLLRARRNLPRADPDAATKQQRTRPGMWVRARAFVANIIFEPPYPAPPLDGTAPPVRDAEELCAEAALQLHIGEILYAADTTRREQGLGWTRDAVDRAEQQLRYMVSPGAVFDKPARTMCRQCLVTGLGNWATMVRGLARAEGVGNLKYGSASPTWSSLCRRLWGEVRTEDVDRWAAEEKVIAERAKQIEVLTEDLDQPAWRGLKSWLVA